MRHRLHIVACIVSGTFGLATLFLWGRSTQALDHALYATARYSDDDAIETTSLYGLLSRQGSIGVWYSHDSGPMPEYRIRALPARDFSWQTGRADNRALPGADRFGFRIGRVDDLVATTLGNEVDYALLVPHWFLILLASILPLRALWMMRRQLHRARRGLCAACGYDLRGSTDRCPECGLPAGRTVRPTKSTA